jgi:hypothetical protein
MARLVTAIGGPLALAAATLLACGPGVGEPQPLEPVQGDEADTAADGSPGDPAALEADGSQGDPATADPSAQDLTPPALSLLGDNPLVVVVGQDYVDPGATASARPSGSTTRTTASAGSTS